MLNDEDSKNDLPDADFKQALVTKVWNDGYRWCPEEKLGAFPERDYATAQVVENQQVYHKRLLEETPSSLTISLLAKNFGPDWANALCRGLAKAFYKSPVHDVVSVQPFQCAPIGVVGFYGHPEILVTEGGVTECNMRLRVVERRAVPRRLGTMLQGSEAAEAMTELWGEDMYQEIADTYMSTMVDETVRGFVFADLLTAAGKPVKLGRSEVLRTVIAREATEIHRRTMRGPGNRVIANPRLRLESSLDMLVIVEPMFNPHLLLVAYQGPSPFMAGYIYSPYVFQYGCEPSSFGNKLTTLVRGCGLLVDDKNFVALEIPR